jgi:hypothetical protein
MLDELWHYQVQVVPVLLALLLIEIPTYIRRKTQFFYVPIYFPLFPLDQLNQDLAYYLKEDYWIHSDETEEQAEALRRRIILRSVGSMALAAVAIPAFAGLVSAFFLDPPILTQFLIVLVLYKLRGIVLAIRDFHTHAHGTAVNRAYVALIYALYLGLMVHMVRAAYSWARPFSLSGNVWGLLGALSDLFFGKALQGLVLAALTAVFMSLVADRRVRVRNIAKREAEDRQRTSGLG